MEQCIYKKNILVFT